MFTAHRPMESLEEEFPAVESDFAKRRYCCCCFPTFRYKPSTSSDDWDRTRVADDSSWWRKGSNVLMKIREWSELVAGPRWKTFIRRFNRNNHRGMAGGGSGRFQYDPLSYALNFDEGPNADSDGEYESGGLHRGFSARFVAVPGSTVSAVDVGRKEASPVFSAAG